MPPTYVCLFFREALSDKCFGANLFLLVGEVAAGLYVLGQDENEGYTAGNGKCTFAVMSKTFSLWQIKVVVLMRQNLHEKDPSLK